MASPTSNCTTTTTSTPKTITPGNSQDSDCLAISPLIFEQGDGELVFRGAEEALGNTSFSAFGNDVTPDASKRDLRSGRPSLYSVRSWKDVPSPDRHNVDTKRQQQSSTQQMNGKTSVHHSLSTPVLTNAAVNAQNGSISRGSKPDFRQRTRSSNAQLRSPQSQRANVDDRAREMRNTNKELISKNLKNGRIGGVRNPSSLASSDSSIYDDRILSPMTGLSRPARILSPDSLSSRTSHSSDASEFANGGEGFDFSFAVGAMTQAYNLQKSTTASGQLRSTRPRPISDIDRSELLRGLQSPTARKQQATSSSSLYDNIVPNSSSSVYDNMTMNKTLTDADCYQVDRTPTNKLDDSVNYPNFTPPTPLTPAQKLKNSKLNRSDPSLAESPGKRMTKLLADDAAESPLRKACSLLDNSSEMLLAGKKITFV